MVKKYDMHPYSYGKLIVWQFGDAIFRNGLRRYSTKKIRRFGFYEHIDSEEMFLNRFWELQRNRIIFQSKRI